MRPPCSLTFRINPDSKILMLVDSWLCAPFADPRIGIGLGRARRAVPLRENYCCVGFGFGGAAVGGAGGGLRGLFGEPIGF
jgi:hypothetical protein